MSASSSPFDTQRAFIDDAGHELRTPITIIRGNLEVMGSDPQEREETIALVTDELDRMSRMVNDLLMLARSDRPYFLTMEPIDLCDLARELHAKASALGERHWHLRSDAVGTIMADRQRLTQAVMQLAQNAVQHTEPGDVITLGCRRSDEIITPGARRRVGEVAWYVRDAGPGVGAADAERIFRRFARAEGGRRRSEGAGLGLAIVRVIAEAHGGRVELERGHERGAEFSVIVPTTPVPDVESER